MPVPPLPPLAKDILAGLAIGVLVFIFGVWIMYMAAAPALKEAGVTIPGTAGGRPGHGAD